MCWCCSGSSRKSKIADDDHMQTGTEADLDSTDPDGQSSQFNGDAQTTGRSVATVNTTYDWDAMYEDQSDSTNNDEPKKSVISYLWSQLRVGMDLTKITLPTYILEQRSLLEMYADFFAHPDMFVAIADASSPSERLIAVTKWYLAAFHAGRKSDVAKKPYNPILGEVFTCCWKSVNGRPNSAISGTSVPQKPSAAVPKFNRNLISDSNRPFFNDGGDFLPFFYDATNTLVFFGEQVSHHPPISAFYAEHVEKRISVNAHIWTKSKFLGLSVGVENVGEATVCVQTGSGTKEEYLLGFPSGYARSILSVPWIELGGDVSIVCPQTGYNCAVEFCTKTMFGNNRNRVIAKLYAPSEPKKPFLVIDGLWNDVMMSQKPDGKNERFIDVKSLTIWNKETRRVMDQEEFESRRLWKHVTRALKNNDVDGASSAKQNVESRQRSEAKGREDKKVEWRPRMFEKRGDGWVFIQALEKRLPPVATT